MRMREMERHEIEDGPWPASLVQRWKRNFGWDMGDCVAEWIKRESWKVLAAFGHCWDDGGGWTVVGGREGQPSTINRLWK
jgi:hypothetical protein